MKASRTPYWSPRRTLFTLSAGFLAITAAWTIFSAIDLHDGHTYDRRGRYEPGPMWHPVNAEDNPSDFKAIMALRFGLPAILLGTIGVICLVGAVAQPKGPYD